MLDVTEIDLVILAHALEDQSDELTWWLNTENGELVPRDGYYGGDVDGQDPEELGLLQVASYGSRDSYRDMEEFVAACGAGVTQDRLSQAIEGRGAFGRFRKTVYETGDLQLQWNVFQEYRITCRAIRWLMSKEVISQSRGEEALTALVEPQVNTPPDPGRAEQDEQLDRYLQIEACAQAVVAEARAIGWLESTKTTLPNLERAIRELARSMES